MQTTLRLDDELYRRAKTKAAEQGMSLTKLVEEAIRERLDRPAPSKRRRRLRLPVSTATGGLVPGFSDLEEAIAAADLAADLRQTR
jgi:predicted transcriptional regulator